MSESQLAEPFTCLNKIDWLIEFDSCIFFFQRKCGNEGGGRVSLNLAFLPVFPPVMICHAGIMERTQSSLRPWVNAKREETSYWPFILPVCNFCKYRLMSKQLPSNYIPSVFYFGGARSKGFVTLRNVSKLPFFDKIGHAKSVGFRFYSAIWRSESRISSRYLEITLISLIYSLTFSRKKELLIWLPWGLNRLTCVTRQIRGDSKLRD